MESESRENLEEEIKNENKDSFKLMNINAKKIIAQIWLDKQQYLPIWLNPMTGTKVPPAVSMFRNIEERVSDLYPKAGLIYYFDKGGDFNIFNDRPADYFHLCIEPKYFIGEAADIIPKSRRANKFSMLIKKVLSGYEDTFFNPKIDNIFFDPRINLPLVNCYQHKIKWELFIPEGSNRTNKQILSYLLEKKDTFLNESKYLRETFEFLFTHKNFSENFFYIKLDTPTDNKNNNEKELDIELLIGSLELQKANREKDHQKDYRINVWKRACNLECSLGIIEKYLCPIIESTFYRAGVTLINKI